VSEIYCNSQITGKDVDDSKELKVVISAVCADSLSIKSPLSAQADEETVSRLSAKSAIAGTFELLPLCATKQTL
jgi:hypothetical protein